MEFRGGGESRGAEPGLGLEAKGAVVERNQGVGPGIRTRLRDFTLAPHCGSLSHSRGAASHLPVGVARFWGVATFWGVANRVLEPCSLGAGLTRRGVAEPLGAWPVESQNPATRGRRGSPGAGFLPRSLPFKRCRRGGAAARAPR